MKRDILIILAFVTAAFCFAWLLCRRFADLEHEQAMTAAKVANLETRLLPVKTDHKCREYRWKIFDQIKGLFGLTKTVA